MTLSIEVEDEAWLALPDLDRLARSAVTAALSGAGVDQQGKEIALLFTSDQSIAAINAEWRGQNKPTNVLSFPAAAGLLVPEGEEHPLGDVVLAYGVVVSEAAEQGKTLRDHTAHLIVHGVLHLLGFDHQSDCEAQKMERLETSILQKLGISDPYD
jgi:probable rRNA maturation factor